MNLGFEGMGYPKEQSREKVFSGRLSLVIAGWAAMTPPQLKPNRLLMETERKVDLVSSECIVINWGSMRRNTFYAKKKKKNKT